MSDTAAQPRNSLDGRSERRRYPRLEAKSMAFLDIGPDNGGIILNISEAGIALKAMSALTPMPVIDLHLRPPKSSKRIETNGKVVWTSSKREAGIQFVDLPDEARLQIRDWLTSEALPGQLVKPRPSETTKPRAEQQANELMSLLSEPSAEAVILHPRDRGPTSVGPPASPPPVPAPLSSSDAVIEKHPTVKSVLAVPPLGTLAESHDQSSPAVIDRSTITIERANKTKVSKMNAASSRQFIVKSSGGQPPLARSFITRSAEVKKNHNCGGAFYRVWARIFDKRTLGLLTNAAIARVVSGTRGLFAELLRPAFDRQRRVWRYAGQAWRRRRRSLLGWLQQPVVQRHLSSVRLRGAEMPTVSAVIALLCQLPRSRHRRRDIAQRGRLRMKAVIRWLRQPGSQSHLRHGIFRG